MPRSLEQVFSEDAPRRGRTSGVYGKKEWKDLKTITPDDLKEYEDLSEDDLEVDDGLEVLPQEDLVEEPHDVSKEAYRATDLEEGMEALAEGDQKRDAVERIKATDRRIAKLRQSTADLIQEKEAIEKQSDRRLEGIRRGSRANMAENARAFEERARPMREVARELGRASALDAIRGGREQAESELSDPDSEVNRQLELNESGEVLGFKNIPYVSGSSFYRAMAGRMGRLRTEMLGLLEEAPGATRDRRLAELERESESWIKMRQDMVFAEENGADLSKFMLRNRLYRQIESIGSGELDKVDYETLTITPEEALEKRSEELKKQDEVLDGLLQQASEVLWSSESFVEGRRLAMAEFLHGAERYRAMKNESLGHRIDFLHTLEATDQLDMKSKRLGLLIDGANAKIELFRSKMGRKMDDASVKTIREVIDSLEGSVSSYRADLDEWRHHPIREEAMRCRAEDVKDKIRELEFERERPSYSELHVQDPKRLSESGFRDGVFSGSAEEVAKAREEYRASVLLMRDRIDRILEEKSDIAKQRAAIVDEQIDREAFSIDVDLSSLDEPNEEIDIDLSELNASVEQAQREKSVKQRGIIKKWTKGGVKKSA